ncbi:MAG: hypothetical protein M1828_004474 [Chrysothrix sp. TS-e1954]|nr:MAG: hypothetical protein M1828_004474 [Chrysothrix sp. TS-e1954]
MSHHIVIRAKKERTPASEFEPVMERAPRHYEHATWGSTYQPRQGGIEEPRSIGYSPPKQTLIKRPNVVDPPRRPEKKYDYIYPKKQMTPKKVQTPSNTQTTKRQIQTKKKKKTVMMPNGQKVTQETTKKRTIWG